MHERALFARCQPHSFYASRLLLLSSFFGVHDRKGLQELLPSWRDTALRIFYLLLGGSFLIFKVDYI